MIGPKSLFDRYQDLQSYVGWTQKDEERLSDVAKWIVPYVESLVDDFYAEVQRHPETMGVLTEGPIQIRRLRLTLERWIEELFRGPYNAAYVNKHWRVGLKHVEIGLHQVYTNAALARLREKLIALLFRLAEQHPIDLLPTIAALNRRLDLDLAIIEDAYEFRRMEDETRAERLRGERKFRNLVEAAACMIVILRPNLDIAYVSPFAERLTGWNSNELACHSFLEAFVEGGSDESDHRLWAEVMQHLPVQDRELPIRCRDGSGRWLIWNILALDDFDNQPAILAVGHDITEKRRADQRLLQSERLAAIGQTITGLAHESRNALQRIHSCTEMLEFEVEDRPEAMRLIRRSQQAQDDLTRLFDEVRSFAAPITLERAPCHIAGVWREAWQLLVNERKTRQAELKEHVEPEDLEVSVDRFRITQVFRNLFENSLAACSDPVVIEVHCRLVREHDLEESLRDALSIPQPTHDEATGPHAGEIALSPNDTHLTDGHGATWIEIRVRDNGPGLSAKARSDVFEPFFTTKSKGTGLGMAIAQRILAAHAGLIVVGASNQTGAEFVIYLPRE